MIHLERMSRDTVTPETSRPAKDRVLEGDPVHTTWSIEERGTLYAGLWQSTPGKWRVSYDEWEYVHILEGRSILTDAAGQAVELKAGDSYIIRPGFEGTWEVLVTTLKDYVILA